MTGPAFGNQDDTRGFYVPQKAYEFTAFNTINRVVVFGEYGKGGTGTKEREGAGGLSASGEAGFASAFEAVQAAADRYERLFSHTDPNSALSHFNRLGGRPEDLDPELGELIDLALAYSTATEGLFDPTVCNEFEAVQEKGSDRVPQCARGLKTPSFERNSAGWAYPLITSLGGIAKGYIADALCDLLKQHGVAHGFVNLGGNVKVFGGKPMSGATSPDGKLPGSAFFANEGEDGVQPFTVGLRVPKKFSFGEDSFATVQLAEGAVVTSGIYERGTRAPDGTWQHHIIDPRTGRPAETDLVSASVICESALEADALATALIVMGLERAREFIEHVSSCEAVFVTNDGTVVATSNMGSKVPLTLL